MKKFPKFIAPLIAIILVLALGITTGCGGCLGLIGIGSCVGGCLGALNSQNIIDNILSGGTGSTTSGSEEGSQSSSSSGSESSGSSSGQESAHSSVSVGSMTYSEYDPTQFYADCEELSSLAKAGKSSEVIEMYEKLYDEFLFIDENSTVLYVNYCLNPSDEYFSEQYVSYSAMYSEALDTLYIAIYDVTQSSCADDFREYVGDEDFEAFAEYEPLTDEQLEYSEQEAGLIDEYYTAIEEFEASGSDYQELYNSVGPIYVELVQLRTKIAQSYGYDNYADYADAEIYYRDYSADDIAAFCGSVKKLSSRFFTLEYNSTALYAPYMVDASLSTTELLQDLKTYGSALSSIVSDAADLMTENNLYNIGSDSTRADRSFTTYLTQQQAPYIFMTQADNLTDFVSLSHESGHYCEFMTAPASNALLSGGSSLDLEEIHSNGLQALFTYYYDYIYGGYSSVMKTYCVADLLSNVVEGCIMDEFQRRVYSDPGMTLEEINNVYCEICEEYGDSESAAAYWWLQVPHNFSSPMYYFSYAASGIVALQIWLLANSDITEAVTLWENFINAGAYEKTYTEVLEEQGVSMFTNPTFVITLMDKALTFAESGSYSLGY